ncbi:MAG TPA: DNA polymerase III subunit beta [Candidatus Woesebacteria bacterium]|nr:DNA polymerase III subunit beta [Candidatus Woesebacteria bacterium]
MKIIVQSGDLKKCLGIVSRGVSSRPQLPILSGLLLKVTQNEVSLVSTDLEVSFWLKLPAKVEEEGEIVLPAKLFSELVASLPSGNVSLESKKHIVKVEVDGINSEIVGQEADDFPGIPRASKSQIVIKSGDFRQKVDRVCVSSARDDTRPVLTGVLWEISEDKVSLVATDGYRLSVDKINLTKTGLEKETRLILPARSLQEVSRMLGETGDDDFSMEFDKDNQQVIFKVGEIEVTSRLIAGEFPPYQQIMPNTYSVRAVVGKEEVLEAVKRASLFARDNANIVKLQIKKDGVVVRAESSQVGTSVTDLTAETEGDEMTVAFNARYLLDYLAICESEKIIWETEGELKPSVFRSEDETTWVQVVMPVRVQD